MLNQAGSDRERTPSAAELQRCIVKIILQILSGKRKTARRACSVRVLICIAMIVKMEIAVMIRMKLGEPRCFGVRSAHRAASDAGASIWRHTTFTTLVN